MLDSHWLLLIPVPIPALWNACRCPVGMGQIRYMLWDVIYAFLHLWIIIAKQVSLSEHYSYQAVKKKRGANKWENSPVAGFQALELPIPSPIIHLPSPTDLWSGSLPLALPTVMSLSISLQCRAPPLWNHLKYWWVLTHYYIDCFSKSSIHSQIPFFLFPLSVPRIPQVIFLVLCPVSFIHSV